MFGFRYFSSSSRKQFIGVVKFMKNRNDINDAIKNYTNCNILSSCGGNILKTSKDLVVYKDPIEKVFLPFTGFNIKMKIDVTFQAVYTETQMVPVYGQKIRWTAVTTRSYTPLCEKTVIKTYSYDNDKYLQTYGGSKPEVNTIEAVIANENYQTMYDFNHEALPLAEKYAISTETSEKITSEKIHERECENLKKWIYDKYKCDEISNFSASSSYQVLNSKFFYLPAYIYTHPSSGLKLYINGTTGLINGDRTIDIVKSSLLAMVASPSILVLRSLLMGMSFNPVVALTISIGSALSTAAITLARNKYIKLSNQYQIEDRLADSKKTTTTNRDIARDKVIECVKKEIDRDQYVKELKTLGIDKSQKVNISMIKNAFRKKVKMCHPDIHPTYNDEYLKIVSAYKTLIKLFK